MHRRFLALTCVSILALAVGSRSGAALNPSESAAAGVDLLRLVVVTEHGTQAVPYSYSHHGSQLRIEQLRPAGPVHWNLVDLAADTVAVVFPHNQSFELLPASPRADQPTSPAPVPGSAAVSARPAVPVATGLDAEQLAALPADLRERLLTAPQGVPGVPPLPSLPSAAAGRASLAALPRSDSLLLPGGVTGARIGSSLVPSSGGGTATPPALERQEDAPRVIHGLSCRRYLLRGWGEPLEIWAAADGPFPFHLLIRERNRFGPSDPRNFWAEAVRDARLFPLEVRTTGTAPRTRFAVVSMRREPVSRADLGRLFAVPAGFRAIETPDFALRR